jgi:hypothetical protein
MKQFEDRATGFRTIARGKAPAVRLPLDSTSNCHICIREREREIELPMVEVLTSLGSLETRQAEAIAAWTG